MSGLIDIAGEGLAAAINPLGAELVSLRDAGGRALMTDADPAFWTGHAPILFPIVGRLSGDVLRLDGRDYPMKQHGFARRRMFALAGATADSVTLALCDDAETRAAYPFAFDLRLSYRIAGAALTMTAEVRNPDPDRALPMSFGWHPAFAWPLPYGAAREDHRITFEADEPGALAALRNGLAAAEPRSSPLEGRTLRLSDALFERDALIWDGLASRRLSYGAEGAPHLDIAFPDTAKLGIWTKPGARFVCIEPWHGIADPEGFAGDFRDKPGVFEVPPGEAWSCALEVTLAA